jgi:hypothetical protein
MIEKSKKLKTINNRKVDDPVVILGGIMLDKPRRATIRQLGIVGFYVHGLATCYYWHEIGRLWRDYNAAVDEGLAPVVKKW